MGLAHVKTRHIPHNFHPVFESYAIRALEYSAFEVVGYIKKIRKIEAKQKSPISCQKYTRLQKRLYKKLCSALLFRCMSNPLSIAPILSNPFSTKETFKGVPSANFKAHRR